MTEAEKAYQYFVIAVPENEEQAKAYFWARKALQSTLTQPNEGAKDKNGPTNGPLTLEEIRRMIEPTPVWWDWVQGWVLARKGMIISWNGVYYNFEEVKGNFYRRPPEGEEKMKVPEYIRQKMHRAAKLHAEASRIIRQVDEYFEGRGYTPENLRCGDGFSLEELDYGNDVTDIFVERIESGEFREPPEGEEKI